MDDDRGCSICTVGEERWESFTTARGNERVQFDYRTPDGDLFSTVAESLEECRAQRDSWAAELHSELLTAA